MTGIQCLDLHKTSRRDSGQAGVLTIIIGIAICAQDRVYFAEGETISTCMLHVCALRRQLAWERHISDLSLACSGRPLAAV